MKIDASHSRLLELMDGGKFPRSARAKDILANLVANVVLAETYTHGKSSVNLRHQVACAMMLPFLNQYQGGMCIAGVLTTTERTPRHFILPLGPN